MHEPGRGVMMEMERRWEKHSGRIETGGGGRNMAAQ